MGEELGGFCRATSPGTSQVFENLHPPNSKRQYCGNHKNLASGVLPAESPGPASLSVGEWLQRQPRVKGGHPLAVPNICWWSGHWSRRLGIRYQNGLKSAGSHTSVFVIFFLMYLFIWLCQVLGCVMQDLVPWTGIEPRAPALGTQSLNHWIPSHTLRKCLLVGPGQGLRLNFSKAPWCCWSADHLLRSRVLRQATPVKDAESASLASWGTFLAAEASPIDFCQQVNYKRWWIPTAAHCKYFAPTSIRDAAF